MFFNKDKKLAITMRWDGKGAPKVTAKGQGLVAEQIIAIAQKHDVPMRQDAELVKLLSTVELNDEIPDQLYLAVAEVIAFAYTLKDDLKNNIDRNAK